MKFGKTIKRIVALGIGVSMVGATVLSAHAAASLNQYPAPFIQNGKFSGVLVVGDNAAAEDVVGVTDIATSLQYAASINAGQATAVGGATVSGDAYQFTKPGDQLNLWENLSSIRQTLDSGDLKALADGTFRGTADERYTQTLKAPNGSAVVTFDTYSTMSEDPALYLKIDKGQGALTYELNFPTAVQSKVDTNGELTDFENNKITILGQEYTVTKAENLSGNSVRLTLMSGAVQDTLEVGQTKTYNINGKDYEVSLTIVSGDTSSTAVAQLNVNGEITKALGKDDTYTLKDGTDLGIKEVLPTKSGDVVQNLVEFYLGANKIVLDGSANTISIGDTSDIADATVIMSTGTSGGDVKLSDLKIIYQPSIDLYIPVGSSLQKTLNTESETDSLDFFQKMGLDLQFTGIVTGNTETVKMGRDTDTSVRLDFTNKNGVQYKGIPIFYTTQPTNSSVYLGKESGKDLLNMNGQTACQNDMFILDSGDSKKAVTRVMKLTRVKNITNGDHFISLQDMGTGSSSNYDFDVNTGMVNDLSLDGYQYAIQVLPQATSAGCVKLTEISLRNGGATGQAAYIYTQTGAHLNLSGGNSTSGNIRYFENDDGLEDNSQDIESFEWNVTWDATKTKLEQGNIGPKPNGAGGASYINMMTLDSDSKKSQGYTKWGTFITEDTNPDQPDWTLTIPQLEGVAQVFLTAGTATISQATGASGQAVILQKIDIGATKLASEIAGSEKTQNVLLVGGPCANAAVEASSSMFPTCAAWPFQPGEAIIQVVDQTDGHVAMLVAGTQAADTRTATRVVADMSALQALSAGVTKKKVTVGSSGLAVLSDIVAPAPVVPAPAANGTTGQ